MAISGINDFLIAKVGNERICNILANMKSGKPNFTKKLSFEARLT